MTPRVALRILVAKLSPAQEPTVTADLSRLRNIGISAHIDSGKTTLTERILFYTNRIHAIHDVRGKDGVGAKMDSMELERERGITIQSAATHCQWLDHHVNIIDTPGHVDFTIEVERALRVLDSAVLVLCSVAGVQSQSITVDRQMKRYGVPRIAFVNKCDRQGANPIRVRDQLREKLGHNAVMMQLPIGLEDRFSGVIDLVTMRACYFDGENGEVVRDEPIPDDLYDNAVLYREEMLDTVSMFSDELTEAMLMEDDEPGSVTPEIIHAAIRKATISLQVTPVLMGSAYKNKAVQKLLDAVVNWLAAPNEVPNHAFDLENDEERVEIVSDPTRPAVALAFKLEEGRYGQLTYLRVYEGTISRGMQIINARSGDKVKVGRLVRMHADEMEDIEEATCGDIVAIFGVDCFSGDTFTDGTRRLSMASIHVPDAVISLTITPVDNKASINMSKALRRFSKEDPTFRVGSDPETGDTIISGMGELHLDVYIERMKREYAAKVNVSPPRVAYRETITQRADYDYLHKKQTGGSGQYGRVIGALEPCEANFEFVDNVVGGTVPREYISAVEKGFKSMLAKGALIGVQVVNVRAILADGNSHAVDSSDIAFQEAARGAWRQVYSKARPVVLEPIMKVVLEGPSEFHGNMVGTLMQRRGMVLGSNEQDGFSTVESEVPLAEMFGYSTALRSATQGKAEFTMEFARYAQAPREVTEELIKKYVEEQKKKAS